MTRTRMPVKAILFDCDGVLADTERDGHRVAFNEAFRRMGLQVTWDIPLYGRLLSVAGGKERMRQFFDQTGWPDSAGDHDAFIAELHRLKTDLYMRIITEKRLPLRPGVARLVDEAIEAGVSLAICSTSDAKGVSLLAETGLGQKRLQRFAAILAGDVVKRKKPDPEIYTQASARIDVPPSECMVVEDSRIGLLAARAAGMRCIITISTYTAQEDFSEADAIYSDLGEPPGPYVTLERLSALSGTGVPALGNDP